MVSAHSQEVLLSWNKLWNSNFCRSNIVEDTHLLTHLTKNVATQREPARLQRAQPERCGPAEDDLGRLVLRPGGGPEEVAHQATGPAQDLRPGQEAEGCPGRRTGNYNLFVSQKNYCNLVKVSFHAISNKFLLFLYLHVALQYNCYVGNLIKIVCFSS